MIKFIKKNSLSISVWLLGIYWVILFTLTTLPGPDLPKLSMKINDKIEHGSAFLILTLLMHNVYWRQKKYSNISQKPLLFTFITVIIYGAFDEIHQLVIPGRYCDIADFMADMAGALIGIIIVVILKKLYHFNKIDSDVNI